MTMAWRAAMLLLAALVALVATGAAFGQTHASAWRVTAAAVAGLLTPLFWPGAETGASRLRAVLFWAALGTAVAVLSALVLGPCRPYDRLALVALQLGALLVAALALAAWLQGPLASAPAAGAAVSLLLALLGALPLWAGPGAPAQVDALVAASPLTHLAVASGNDLLRNAWLYENTPLGGLPVDYPPALAVALGHAALLAAVATGLARPRRPHSPSVPLETFR